MVAEGSSSQPEVAFRKAFRKKKAFNYGLARLLARPFDPALFEALIEVNFEFLNPRRAKSIQYIGLKFLGTVNRAKLFQYSELILNFFYN